MLTLKRILVILNLKTAIISALAVLSTYLCLKFGLTGNFPLTLLATAVVFPIVFSISGAYKRRESALDDYGTMKAHIRAMYFAVRDWPEKEDAARVEKAKNLFAELITGCRRMFSSPISEMSQNEDAVYRSFSRISTFIREDLRDSGLASGEISRTNQYLSKTITAFESIKHIYQYRTPQTLRAFSDFFISILPILYGPYFAHLSQDYATGLTYIMPVLFAVILVSLDNIQAHLENPFDQIGEDDIIINAEKLIAKLELE